MLDSITLSVNLFPILRFFKLGKKDYTLEPMKTFKVETGKSKTPEYHTTEKTLKDWYNLLPKHVQEKVDLNMQKFPKNASLNDHTTYPSQYLALWNAFDWSKTSERSNYWLDIARNHNIQY